MQMETSIIRKYQTCESGNLFNYAVKLNKNCKQNSRINGDAWENQMGGFT